MIKDILQIAALPGRPGRYLNPPAETYGIYFDEVTADGADPIALPAGAKLPRIYTHNIRLELYEPTPDDAKEAKVEAALCAKVGYWYKSERIWLASVQRYQVYYEFNYTTKY